MVPDATQHNHCFDAHSRPQLSSICSCASIARTFTVFGCSAAKCFASSATSLSSRLSPTQHSASCNSAVATLPWPEVSMRNSFSCKPRAPAAVRCRSLLMRQSRSLTSSADDLHAECGEDQAHHNLSWCF